MSTTKELTSNIRYRVKCRWFRAPLVILQVEEHEKGFYTTCTGGSIDTKDVDRKYYRDARIEDITHEC